MTSTRHDPGQTGPGTGADPGEPAVARPRPNVANVAIGAAMLAADQVQARFRSAEYRALSAALGFLEKARDRADQTRTQVRTVVDVAERRGRDGLDGGRHQATSLVDSTVNGALGWIQVNVMPQLIDGLVPHLISDVVPRLIDGAMPEINARVVPVLIEDLTNDPRVRELILAQSRGVLREMTEQIRTGTTRADDRIEVAAHRVFGRTEKGNNTGKGAQDTRGA